MNFIYQNNHEIYCCNILFVKVIILYLLQYLIKHTFGQVVEAI